MSDFHIKNKKTPYSKKEAIKKVAKERNIPKSEVYNEYIKIEKGDKNENE